MVFGRADPEAITFYSVPDEISSETGALHDRIKAMLQEEGLSYSFGDYDWDDETWEYSDQFGEPEFGWKEGASPGQRMPTKAVNLSIPQGMSAFGDVDQSDIYSIYFDPSTGIVYYGDGNTHHVDMENSGRIPLDVFLYPVWYTPYIGIDSIDAALIGKERLDAIGRLMDKELGVAQDDEDWGTWGTFNESDDAIDQHGINDMTPGIQSKIRYNAAMQNNRLEWTPGNYGKGWLRDGGVVWTWNVDEASRSPYHMHKDKELKRQGIGRGEGLAFEIDPDGVCHRLGAPLAEITDSGTAALITGSDPSLKSEELPLSEKDPDDDWSI
jgi:hypothetical protein